VGTLSCITDNSLDFLVKNCEKLWYLNILLCANVSYARISDIKKSFLDLDIRHSPDDYYHYLKGYNDGEDDVDDEEVDNDDDDAGYQFYVDNGESEIS
jgi:hypothetical protein